MVQIGRAAIESTQCRIQAGSPTYTLGNLFREYIGGLIWYKALFEIHLKEMLAVLAILSVFLSALQMGLAIIMLQDNGMFQRALYSFTVA